MSEEVMAVWYQRGSIKRFGCPRRIHNLGELERENCWQIWLTWKMAIKPIFVFVTDEYTIVCDKIIKGLVN